MLVYPVSPPPPPADLRAAYEAIRELRASAEHAGWDVPMPLTQATARATLARLHESGHAGVRWRTPHVSSSPTGVIALEWWNRPRDLTIYAEGSSVCFVRSWGTSIAHEMDDADLNLDDAAGLAALWDWLESGKDVR